MAQHKEFNSVYHNIESLSFQHEQLNVMIKNLDDFKCKTSTYICADKLKPYQYLIATYNN